MKTKTATPHLHRQRSSNHSVAFKEQIKYFTKNYEKMKVILKLAQG